MKRPPKALIALVVLVLAGAAAWFAWRPSPQGPEGLAGYVEGETLHLAAPVAGGAKAAVGITSQLLSGFFHSNRIPSQYRSS